MTRLLSLILATTLLSACQDDPLELPRPEIPGPLEALPPSPRPDIAGEYVMQVDVGAYVCPDGEMTFATQYGVTDLVPQAEPGVFDILGAPYGFINYEARDLPIARDGFFDLYEEFLWDVLGTGIVSVWRRHLQGSAVSPYLDLEQTLLAGIYDEDGIYVPACTFSVEAHGTLRYRNWRGTPRSSIDGKWLIERTLVEDSDAARDRSVDDAAPPRTFAFIGGGVITDAPLDAVLDDLPETAGLYRDSEDYLIRRNQVADVIIQDDDGSLFDIRGLLFGFDGVPRQIDGTVDVEASNPWNEITLKGTVTEDRLGLELVWRQLDPLTGETLHLMRERYVGQPRYEERNPDSGYSTSARGAYNAHYVLVANDCSNESYDRHRVVDVRPIKDGQVRMFLGGTSKVPTISMPVGGGPFGFTYVRNDFYLYVYRAEGFLTGDGIWGTLTIEVSIPDFPDFTPCTFVYEISGDDTGGGFKRYEDWDSPVP